MTKVRPVMMTWTDAGAMVPHARFRPLCDKQFVVGADYPMVPVEPRSMKQHNRYFAELHTLWLNLPEDVAAKFKTEEGFRAKGLVETGWCTEKDYACDNAQKANYLARIIRAHAEYAVIKVSGDVVKVFEPKSQSIASMGAEDFKKSQKEVLDWAASLIPGIDRKEVRKAAAQMAPPDRKIDQSEEEPTADTNDNAVTS